MLQKALVRIQSETLPRSKQHALGLEKSGNILPIVKITVLRYEEIIYF